MNLSIGFLNLRRPALPLIARILTLAGVAFATANLSADDQPAARPAANSPAATRTIAGRVVDSDGKPVAGARVWWVVQREPGFMAAGRADGDGQFRMTTPADWMPREEIRRADVVWAMGPQDEIAVALAKCGLVNEGKSREWILRLISAKDVTIAVVDANGRPVAGATVEPVNFRGGQGFDLIPDPISIALRANTDATGQTRLHIGSPYFLNVRVTSDPFGIQVVQLTPRGFASTRTVRLGDVGRIEGRVTAKDPSDVRRVRIGFRSVLAFTEGVAAAISDERGNFVVPKIAACPIVINTRSRDGSSAVAPRLPKNFSLGAGETAHLEISLEPLVTVRGSVQTEDTHAPVAGANVTVAFGNGMQGAQAVTDLDGRFEVRVLPGLVNSPAIISLPEAIERDYEQAGEPWDNKITVPPGDKPFEMSSVVLLRRITMLGKVIDQDGRPLAKATVCGDVGNRRYGFCETDANGQFTMRVPHTISPERYEVLAPPTDRHRTVTIVQKSPLVLKAVDWSKFAKPIPPQE
jgi:hypothetical protein